jgi:hypothetical protein
MHLLGTSSHQTGHAIRSYICEQNQNNHHLTQFNIQIQILTHEHRAPKNHNFTILLTFVVVFILSQKSGLTTPNLRISLPQMHSAH